MTPRVTVYRVKSPFEKSKNRVEILASNLYYSLSMNKYIIKLQQMPLPISVTIDDIVDRDFVIGNLLTADSMMQEVLKISA